MDNDQALALWQVEDGVRHVVLNRPDTANALNTAFGQALCDVIAQAARTDVGAVLLSSRGKQFCAGGDINEFAERGADPTA